MRPEDIRIEDYDYGLPAGHIAQFPLENRDESKLLVYKDGEIGQDIFRNLVYHLPANSYIVFNETRVVQARLLFRKETGAEVEVFCLEPAQAIRDIQIAIQQCGSVTWKCLVGNARKWKSGLLYLETGTARDRLRLEARLIERIDDHFIVRFSWSPESYPFSAVLENLGKTPLPPYIRRHSREEDKTRYQTVFAREEGSIAAPTAGLHFTEKVLKDLKKRNIKQSLITLHVGAGTFKPVVAETVDKHVMHDEQVSVPVETVRNLMNNPDRPVILVGTTTVRTLESLYWQGVKWLSDKNPSGYLEIDQWDPYNVKEATGVPARKALGKVLEVMDEHGLEHLTGSTRLIILPGYRYRIADIMVTNFHLPKSTLLLLVSAFIGEDWKKAYTFAMQNNFRFLSYGDSCLFFKKAMNNTKA